MSSLRFFLVASSPVNPRISELILYNEESKTKSLLTILSTCHSFSFCLMLNKSEQSLPRRSSKCKPECRLTSE